MNSKQALNLWRVQISTNGFGRITYLLSYLEKVVKTRGGKDYVSNCLLVNAMTFQFLFSSAPGCHFISQHPDTTELSFILLERNEKKVRLDSLKEPFKQTRPYLK